MSEIKIPIYPDEFFNFADGVDMSDEYINKTIKEIVNEMISNDECGCISRGTGNTKIEVVRDKEMNALEIEVYKNYQRKYIQL